MADNIEIYDANGVKKTIKTKDTGGVHTQEVRLPAAATLADGLATPSTPPAVAAHGVLWDHTLGTWVLARDGRAPTNDGKGATLTAPLLWNGSTYDRAGGHGAEDTLLSSASRSATTSSATQTWPSCRGGLFLLEVTATPAAGSQLYIILRPDLAVGADPHIVNSNDLRVESADGPHSYGYLVYPGVSGPDWTPGTNQVHRHYSRALPRKWYADVVHSGTVAAWTYALYVLPMV